MVFAKFVFHFESSLPEHYGVDHIFVHGHILLLILGQPESLITILFCSCAYITFNKIKIPQPQGESLTSQVDSHNKAGN